MPRPLPAKRRIFTEVDGAALKVAERRKHSTYPELARGGPQKLLVLGSEIGRRWTRPPGSPRCTEAATRSARLPLQRACNFCLRAARRRPASRWRSPCALRSSGRPIGLPRPSSREKKGSCLASSMAPPAGQQLLQLCLKVSGLDASSRSEKFNGRVRALVSQLVRH